MIFSILLLLIEAADGAFVVRRHPIIQLPPPQQQPINVPATVALAKSRNPWRQQSPRTSRLAAASTTSSSSAATDSRGAALLLQEVSVYQGPASILKDIDWRVEPGTKWALLGPNGAGKSSLLQAITDVIDMDDNNSANNPNIHYDGTILLGSKERKNVGYLQQTAVAGSTRTVRDEAASGMTALQSLQRRMQQAEAAEDWTALEKATAQYQAAGGYQQELKVATVLQGLGFGKGISLDARCDELSGGWQMRVALARLLLSEPALCLMDEPSNHLDSAAKRWLANYLTCYNAGSLILVTHDVGLLDSMDHIAEIIPSSSDNGGGGGRLHIYKSCNYQQYLNLKQERAASAAAEYEKNRAKADKLQAFVDRFGASATKAKSAQSRVKMLERMEREGLLDSSAASGDGSTSRFQPTLQLPDPPRGIGDVLLSLKDATVGYSNSNNNNSDGRKSDETTSVHPLVTDVNLDITKGMRLLIRGANGAGKSTILQSLRDTATLPLLEGKRTANPGLRLGMFTQDLAQELDVTARAVDLVTAYARGGDDNIDNGDGDIHVTDEQARTVLGALGLQGEKALRKVGDLSGGEKARVALAMFALKPSNVYLLDEVSNHCDSECVEALSTALRAWDGGGTNIHTGKQGQGAIVVVSHDQNFCRKLDFTHVATVANGKLVLEQRGIRDSDWVIEDMSSSSSASSTVASDEPTAANGAATTAVDAKLRKQAYNAPKRIAKLETLIERAETKIAALDEEMMANGSDVGKLVDLTKDKEALESQVLEYMDEWEELEQLLAQVATGG